MKQFTMTQTDQIMIGKDINISIANTHKKTAQVSITAPKSKAIIREELMEDYAHKRLKVLVVEDEKIIQFTYKAFLQSLGFRRFDIVEDVKSALTKLLEKEYDLIFLDINLPDFSGITLCEIIRNKLNLKTPIIFVSSLTDDPTIKQQCIEAGGNSTKVKPLLEKDIIEITRKFYPICFKNNK